tara:strand:+ start:774 stop:1463 length:690 start_codon:yes stop_codon:yes gene_type:complete
MIKRRKWFPYLFGALLIATLWIAKLMSDEKERKVERQEQKQAPILQQIIASTGGPYQWPMEKTGVLQNFAEFGKAPRFPNLYHSAVDYFAAPGTEVYAISDGIVYFSDHEPGYGGVIIIEHTPKGAYSLYGHVSARRWLIEKGSSVTKGQLIGYIAETDEGYGIGIVPHLHFSIRLGSPSDYPNSGRSNWMTGYTTEHPIYHQFVNPNKLISQSKLYYRTKQQGQPATN